MNQFEGINEIYNILKNIVFPIIINDQNFIDIDIFKDFEEVLWDKNVNEQDVDIELNKIKENNNYKENINTVKLHEELDELMNKWVDKWIERSKKKGV